MFHPRENYWAFNPAPDGAHENQFGFRTGTGTASACSFLNDLMQYCRFNGSPMFICSLDAERYFNIGSR